MSPSLSNHNSGVCKELDDLLLQYLELVDEHLAAWNRISDRFQQGREQISQAKYIMGPRNVSSDCYDLRMKALKGVTVHGPKDIALRDILAEQKLAAKEAATDNDQDIARSRQASENGEGVTDTLDGRAGLRRRGGGGGVLTSETAPLISNDEDTIVDNEKHKKKSTNLGASSSTSLVDNLSTGALDPAITSTPTKKKKERNPDPLLWFGVFVPAPLRSAQSLFQKGLQDVVEMAMIRQRLLELEESIIALKRSKDQSS
ncbi:hypothetical protein BGZ46_003852 [Entomortierella lignicola]|nr:hypothetical protein BGZ46_003852 [Entomortierella lignicola]